MANQYNDTSVLNFFELDTVDIGGDPVRVQLYLCYDLDADVYTVEKFAGGKSHDLESFDSQEEASDLFRLWVADVQRDDIEYRDDA